MIINSVRQVPLICVKTAHQICHGDSEHIKIKKKTDKPGIDIYIDGKTDGEAVYIPVVLSKSGMTDLVYNDFYVEGWRRCKDCGRLRNPQQRLQREQTRRHPYLPCGQARKVRYVEKHYGEGDGEGKRILNPGTEVYMEENSYMEMEMVQIKGVDSTKRETKAVLAGRPGL